MKTAAIAIVVAVSLLAALLAVGWFIVGGVEVPQSFTLGYQTTPEHEYKVVWPHGHHYQLELRPQTGTWDWGLTGTVAIAHDGITLLEKPVTSIDSTVQITCPQAPGEGELDAGEEYAITVNVTYPDKIDRIQLQLSGLKDYRDVWMRH